MKRILTIITAILAFAVAQAQDNHIIFTEYDPDTCFTLDGSGTVEFDLDHDGTGDIVMDAYWHSAVGNIAVITTPSSDWQWSWTYSSEFLPLTDTTLLNGNLEWQYSGGELAMYPDFSHFAFRHLTDDGYCYGWAHIYVQSLARVCVDRMAYCDWVGYPLVWGQTSLAGVDENESTIFATLHPNPTTGFVTITGENLRQAELLNMLGQKVLTERGEGDELQIDLTALPAGVYFVNVIDDEGRKCVRKVIKE